MEKCCGAAKAVECPEWVCLESCSIQWKSPSCDAGSLYWNIPCMLISVVVHPTEAPLVIIISIISGEKGVMGLRLFRTDVP
jgi:hypothetical protein